MEYDRPICWFSATCSLATLGDLLLASTILECARCDVIGYNHFYYSLTGPSDIHNFI